MSDDQPPAAATFPLGVPVRFRPLPPAEDDTPARSYPRQNRQYDPLEPTDTDEKD